MDIYTLNNIIVFSLSFVLILSLVLSINMDANNRKTTSKSFEEFYNCDEGLCTNIKLPRSAIDHASISLSKALLNRRSCRNFNDKGTVTLSQISEILFAAQGITQTSSTPDELGHDSETKRTAPSGGSIYPLELYVIAERVEGLSQGIFKFEAEYSSLIGPLWGTSPNEIKNADLITTPFGVLHSRVDKDTTSMSCKDSSTSNTASTDMTEADIEKGPIHKAASTTTPHSVSALEAAANHQTWVNDAACAILFAGNLSKVQAKGDLYPTIAEKLINIEVGMAAQNALLSVASMYDYGVGACPVGAFNINELKKKFHLPSGIIPVLLLAIGERKNIPELIP